MFNLAMKFALARLKLVMAGFALGAAGLLMQLVEMHIVMPLLGMPIPAEIKTAVSLFVAGIVGNYTDNVDLLPEGFAVPRATLPSPVRAVELVEDAATS